MESGCHTMHLYLKKKKVDSMPKKESQAKISESSHVQWFFIKAIASLPILQAIFHSFFFLKRIFLRKPGKPGHGNLVLITSTIQVELLKLNFNFDDIRIYFLQVLRNCRQITFIKLNRFYLLSLENHPLFLADNIKMDRILTKIFCNVFQVWKVLLIKVCKIQSLDLLFVVDFIGFYISRYHFSQVFRTSFNIIWKKDFCHKFFFLTDPQNPLSLTKSFRHKRSSRIRLLFYPVTYSGFWYSWLLFPLFCYWTFANCMNRERLTLFLCSIS